MAQSVLRKTGDAYKGGHIIMEDYNCEYSDNDLDDRYWEDDDATRAAEEAVFVASYIEKVDRYYR